MNSKIVYVLLVGVAILAQTSFALKEEDCEGKYRSIVRFCFSYIY